MKIETLKTVIRPGMAIWAMALLTLRALELIYLDGVLMSIVIAAIVQWIPDRAIKRVREAWNV